MVFFALIQGDKPSNMIKSSLSRDEVCADYQIYIFDLNCVSSGLVIEL